VPEVDARKLRIDADLSGNDTLRQSVQAAERSEGCTVAKLDAPTTRDGGEMRMRSWKLLSPILISMTVLGAPMAAYAVTVEFYAGRGTEPGANLFSPGPNRTATGSPTATIGGTFGSCLSVVAKPNTTAATASAQTTSGVNFVRVNARIRNLCGTQQVGLIRVFHTFSSVAFGQARGYAVTVQGGIVPDGLSDPTGNRIEKRSWTIYPFLAINPSRVIAGATRTSPTEAIGTSQGPSGTNFVVAYGCTLPTCALTFGPSTPGASSEAAFSCSTLKTAWSATGTCPSTGQETIEDHYIVRVNAGDSIDFTNMDGASGPQGPLTAYNTSRIVRIDLQPLGDLDKNTLSFNAGGDKGTFLVALLGAEEIVGGEDGGNGQLVRFDTRPCEGLTVFENCVLYSTVTAGPGGALLKIQNTKDVDKDGTLDRVLQGKNNELGYACGDPYFVVQGQAYFGPTLFPFEAVQAMETEPCN
jgi:hypothetical protein